jgi:hypothetical protein
MATRNKKIGQTVYTEAYTENDLVRKYDYSRKNLQDTIVKDNWFNCDNCEFYYDANYSATSQINQHSRLEEIVCHNCAN